MKVNLFLAGCQKSASTWLYKCFHEHPDIFVPEKDAIHFFTINYYRGERWYERWFDTAEKERIVCDPTPSYLRDLNAASRIKVYNPDAKILVVLRNPAERAFSHYWHMKKKGLISYRFEDVLRYNGVGNIDLFQMWIQASLYYDQLMSYYKVFDKDRVLVKLFDELKDDPKAFLNSIYDFLDVERLDPSVLNKRINAAEKNIKRNDGILGIFKKAAPIERFNDLSRDFQEELQGLFQDDLAKVSKLIHRDLSRWLKT